MQPDDDHLPVVNTRHPYWPDLTDDEGDALAEWFDDTCGDCLTGRCHWGGETSRESEAAVNSDPTHDHDDPGYGRCGCSHHRASVIARRYRDPLRTSAADALAWREAKQRGDVVVEHD